MTFHCNSIMFDALQDMGLKSGIKQLFSEGQIVFIWHKIPGTVSTVANNAGFFLQNFNHSVNHRSILKLRKGILDSY